MKHYVAKRYQRAQSFYLIEDYGETISTAVM